MEDDVGSSDESSESGGESRGQPLSVSSFPLATLKRLIKKDDGIRNVSQEAVRMISRCCELYLARLGNDALSITRARKQSTIRDTDVCSAIHSLERHAFLRGDVPPPPEYVAVICVVCTVDLRVPLFVVCLFAVCDAARIRKPAAAKLQTSKRAAAAKGSKDIASFFS